MLAEWRRQIWDRHMSFSRTQAFAWSKLLNAWNMTSSSPQWKIIYLNTRKTNSNLWCCLLVPAAKTFRKSLNFSLESVSKFPPIDQHKANRKRDWSHCKISASVLAGFSSMNPSNSSSSITVFFFSSWGGSLVAKTYIRKVCDQPTTSQIKRVHPDEAWVYFHRTSFR